jgi:hypothetical protein
MEDGDMEWEVTDWEHEVFDGGRDGVVVLACAWSRQDMKTGM